MQIKKNIAATLKSMMDVNQKTKLEFSKELDIPRSTLQEYLKGETDLRADSIEELAKRLGISPVQLISGPEWLDSGGSSCLDAALLEISGLHPQAQTLANEAVSLLRSAFRISEELSELDSRRRTADHPEYRYKYVLHELWDPFRGTYSYGILGKERMAEKWVTVAIVAAFSRERSAVAQLARRCTELQLSPEHLLDVIQDFLVQEALQAQY